MAYRIAVASSDGKVVNQHFGRAKEFLVFTIEEGAYQFDKTVAAVPFCGEGGHDDDALKNAVDALKECRAVLASQIGRGAVNALTRSGVSAFDIGEPIDSALRKLIQYYSRIDGGKQHD